MGLKDWILQKQKQATKGKTVNPKRQINMNPDTEKILIRKYSIGELNFELGKSGIEQFGKQ